MSHRADESQRSPSLPTHRMAPGLEEPALSSNTETERLAGVIVWYLHVAFKSLRQVITCKCGGKETKHTALQIQCN